MAINDLKNKWQLYFLGLFFACILVYCAELFCGVKCIIWPQVVAMLPHFLLWALGEYHHEAADGGQMETQIRIFYLQIQLFSSKNLKLCRYVTKGTSSSTGHCARISWTKHHIIFFLCCIDTFCAISFLGKYKHCEWTKKFAMLLHFLR